MALVTVAFFITLALFVALVFVVVTALIVVIAFADCCKPFVVYPHPLPCRRRRMTPQLPCHVLASVASLSPSPSILGFFPLADASSMRPHSSLLRHILIVAGLILRRCDISLKSNSTSPFSILEALVEESSQKKRKCRKSLGLLTV